MSKMTTMMVVMLMKMRETDWVWGGRLKDAVSEPKLPVCGEAKGVQLSCMRMGMIVFFSFGG